MIRFAIVLATLALFMLAAVPASAAEPVCVEEGPIGYCVEPRIPYEECLYWPNPPHCPIPGTPIP